MSVPMNVKEHAYSARVLQDACGGADRSLEILRPTPFAMGQTHLYDCRDPGTGRTMPVGAIAVLERHQNWRFYSLKLFRSLEPAVAPEGVAPDPTLEAAEAFEAMAEVTRAVRSAAMRGFNETRSREIEQAMTRVEAHFARIRAALDVTLTQAAAA